MHSTTRTHQREHDRRHKLLEHMLEERGVEVQARLKALREALPEQIGGVKDTDDQSLADFIQGMELALLELNADAASRIQDSLRRLEAGTYGRCCDCDEPIATARLKALPFAERCRACQELAEAQAGAQAAVRLALHVAASQG